jgi:hypothetical protein
MRVDEDQVVVCRVAFGDADIYQGLHGSPSDELTPISEQADAMSVTLSGENDLGLRMVSSQEQVTKRDTITQWIAYVKPQKPGHYRMNIDVAYLYPLANGTMIPSDLFTDSKEIRTEAGLKYRVAAFWDKVTSEAATATISTIVTLLIGSILVRAGIKKTPRD